MIDRPHACPRCEAGTVYRETDTEGTRWYCLICGWRETSNEPTVPAGFERSRKARHGGYEL